MPPQVICPNGHSVCHQCCRGMRTCPQCRAPCLDKPIPNISLLKTLGQRIRDALIHNSDILCLDNLVNLKVLVLGAAGVGKSSLMLRFTDDRFMPDILPTVGLDFRVKVGRKNTLLSTLLCFILTGYRASRLLCEALYLGHRGSGEIPEHQLILLQRGPGTLSPDVTSSSWCVMSGRHPGV